ncbi:hypothetical protein ABC382_00870 [Lysinibacillus sp. 1P01SD]|uniref:hypothetical protein n=1 Tax=Lysinibacillus sp. 1P01SD TaxID=3132285 RepID=UPI0039A0EBED
MFAKEKDMFPLVKEFLLKKVCCEAVYAEVIDRDIVGVLGERAIIVELKKQLSFKVIEQAIRSKENADYVFVAVPKPKTYHSNLAKQLLKENGIGLIYVEESEYFGETSNATNIVFWARRNKKITRSIINSIDKKFHSETIGGVKSGENPSHYDYMIDEIKWYLRRSKGWVTIDDLLDNLASPHSMYRKPKESLMQTLRGYWNEDWCERKVINRRTHFKLKE